MNKNKDTCWVDKCSGAARSQPTW